MDTARVAIDKRTVRIVLLAVSAIICAAVIVPLAIAWREHSVTIPKGADSNRICTCLRVIYLAMKEFTESGKCLPTASVETEDGTVLYSWRVSLGTLVEDVDEWKFAELSKPWNSPENATFRSLSSSFGFGYNDSSDAKLLGVVGEGTAFDRTRFCTLSDMPPSLILLCEKCDSSVFWMSPGDIDVDTISKWDHETAGRVLCPGMRGFHVLFADGVIWQLSADTPMHALTVLFRGKSDADMDRNPLERYRLR